MSSLIAYSTRYDCFVNLDGDYDYLGSGYYDSQDLELEGKIVYPRCKEALDAYVTPLLLEKAKLFGMPVPSFYMTSGYFEPPVIVDAVNPFMSKQSVVRSADSQQRISKSLTRNFKYMICCQDLPPNSHVGWFRAILGHAHRVEYREIARAIWDNLHLPLAKVRVIRTAEGAVLLSGIWPLNYTDLNERERAIIDREVEWLR